MNGALPPSSIEVRLTVEAHSSISCLPTSVEPVKVSFRTSGLDVISRPISAVLPVTTLTTPCGTPASSARWIIASADSGVAFAGLQATVQPAASAGAIFRASIAFGKFHGVMQATTPTGRRMQTTRLDPSGGGMTSP